MFAKIALKGTPYAVDRPYSYVIPEWMLSQAIPGMRVFVPFGRANRVTEGIILAVTDQEEPDITCKEVIRIADNELLLTPELLKLALFMRERYFCTVYDAIKTILPAGYWFDKSGRQRNHDQFREIACLAIPLDEALQIMEAKKKRAPKQAEVLDLLCAFGELSSRDLLQFTNAARSTLNQLAKAGIIQTYHEEVLRKPELNEISRKPLPILTDEQEKASAYLSSFLTNEKAEVSLLSGVTGSGKTSVYAHLIGHALKKGKSVILLVPEIALTPQTLTQFTAWFGEEVAVLHSGLSSGERYDEWKRIRRGEAHVVIGTRSAVFAPVEKLGAIIIDEEQEDSYSSESNPRYQARDIAYYRCVQNKSELILGSATPDIRSRYNAKIGKYHFCRLSHRFNTRPLPVVHIIDMKEELASGNRTNLSLPLIQAIQERIDHGEQSILFLNRRGTNKLVSCSRCGFVYKCPHCSVSLTWHASRHRMMCHYCGYSRNIDAKCPECGGILNFYGAGTQMLEEELQSTFQGVSVLRVDADTVKPSSSHRVLFQRFIDDNIPIMIGTQMIAKGLNFDNVTLVGVISADQSLYANDFRAGEKTFSLLTQVIGRAGRSEKPGEAYIQTFTPENEILKLAASQDYETFFTRELEMRRLQNAPPFYEWVAFNANGSNEAEVMDALRYCRVILEQLLREEIDIQIMGPLPLPVSKINDRFRYRLQICCKMSRKIRQILSSVLIMCSKNSKLRNIVFYIETEPGQ